MMDRGLEREWRKVRADYIEGRMQWWTNSSKETPFLFVTGGINFEHNNLCKG